MNSILLHIRSLVQNYDHKKYWRLRNRIVTGQGSKLSRLICLYRVKKMDARNCATMGTHWDKSATFASPPNLPHGLYGIVVSHNAIVGKNATIFHQVTIGEGNGGAPTIGDNVYIGAGAKIIGNITIGNNVKIGANCVVFMDVPDNCTVVLPKSRVIVKHENGDAESKDCSI